MHGGHIERDESPISFAKPKITKHVHLVSGWFVTVLLSTPCPDTKRWKSAYISQTVALVYSSRSMVQVL